MSAPRTMVSAIRSVTRTGARGYGPAMREGMAPLGVSVLGLLYEGPALREVRWRAQRQ